MNTCTFSGRLTKDAEIKSFTAGEKAGKCYRFTVAVDRNLSKAQREKAESEGKPTADFVPVTFFVTGETAMNYWAPNGVERLHKGAFVEICNSQFRTESYEKEGKTVYTSYFHAVEVKVLNIAQADSSAPAQAPAPASAPAPAPAPAPASAPVTASVPATVQASAIAEAVVKMPWD